jgi:ESS family glutamate:Na+ symporter
VEGFADGVVHTGLAVAGLMLVGQGVVRLIPALHRVGVPAAMIGGVAGLLLGSEGLGALPFRRDVLEQVVYHGLALTFIAVALRPPEAAADARGARGMALGIGLLFTGQALIGLLCVLALGLLGAGVHPGFGAILPLGFEQGPGQAMSLGSAWEAGGMPDGAQVGLIVAAIGFAWCVVVGVPLVAWGRRRWGVAALAGGVSRADDEPEPVGTGGDLEPLAAHAGAIGLVYAVTWFVCEGVYRLLSFAPDIAHMVWGFPFLFGALVGMILRRPLARALGLNGRMLGRIAGMSVDVTTVAALAAIELAVVWSHAVPIGLVTTVGGLATAAASVGLATRLFPKQTLEHVAVLFGMGTGTTPTGLALLRMVDPLMRSSASGAAIGGSAMAIPMVAPVLIGVLPLAVSGSVGAAVGACVVWIGVLLVGGWFTGTLRR